MANLAEFVFQADKAVCKWVCERLPEPVEGFEEGQYRAIGLLEDGKMICGWVYHSGIFSVSGLHSIEISVAAVSRWATRPVLEVFMSFPFIELGATRLMAITTDGNQSARKSLTTLGFTFEGTMRSAYPSGADALIYGMLRSECRWLNGCNS